MIPLHVYQDLLRYWDTYKFKAMPEQAKKARGSLKGGSLHVGGAKSVGIVTRELEKELGWLSLHDEVFRRYYMKKKKNDSDPDQWVEKRVEQAYRDYEQYIQELGDSVELIPELSNQVWMEKVA